MSELILEQDRPYLNIFTPPSGPVMATFIWYEVIREPLPWQSRSWRV